MKNFLFLLISVISLNSGFAQTKSGIQDSLSFDQMSLEQLMNVKVTVATELPMIARESPGIVTVITKEEILKSGAHDLIQILDKIPGFNFGVDVEGVVGIGVRGNWGHEGKVQLLWDGIELNEELYSTTQFGGHYPVSQIKRIEIIRGPGSAMYGGNAEFSVINVVTINPDLDGLVVDGQYSTFGKAIASNGINLCYGKNWEKTHLGFATYLDVSNRSDRKYVDNYGNAYSLSNQSAMKTQEYRMDFSHKKFSLIALCNLHSILQRDGYDQVYSQAYRSRFNHLSLNAKYEFKLGKFNFTPGVRWKMEHPWFFNGFHSNDAFQPFDVTSNKNLVYLNYSVEAHKNINVKGGFQYYNLIANDHQLGSYFQNGTTRFETNNFVAFLQSIIKTKPVNFTLGGRFVHNRYFGNAFVPRVGITKLWEKFHVKALYSLGYRAPSIENVNANNSIRPEYTTVVEFEGGVQIGSHSYLTTNIYDITTKDPIIFYYDGINDMENYMNETKTGTRGVEVDYKWKANKWYAGINYAFTSNSGHTTISEFQVPGNSTINLAFPQHKFNFISNWNLLKDFCLSASFTVISKRYSYASEPSEKITVYDPAVYANVNLSFENFLFNGLTTQIGVFNLFDKEVYYIQPYANNHAPLPGGGREFQLKLNYKIFNN